MLKFLSLCWIIPCFLHSAYDYKITVASMFRDEAPYLKEWIDYHSMIGVEYFYLYDNSSFDDWRSVLKPYIEKGVVEVVDWKGLKDNEKTRQEGFPLDLQVQAFCDAIVKFRGKTEWFAFLDIDEFVLPMKNKSIPECLDEHYANVSGVYVSWLTFGTNGVTLKEGESLLRNLTKSTVRGHQKNDNGKSFLRPEDVDLDNFMWHHYCRLKPEKIYMDGDKNVLQFNGVKMNWDWKLHDRYIRINHYFLRDENFYKNRRMALALAGIGPYSVRQLEEFHEQMSVIKDRKMVTFLDTYYPSFMRQH